MALINDQSHVLNWEFILISHCPLSLTLNFLVIQMLLLKNFNRVTMSASFAVRKWQLAAKNYHAITYSTPAAWGLGFNGNRHVLRVEWMFLGHPHHLYSNSHLSQPPHHPLATLQWGLPLHWLQGYHRKDLQMVFKGLINISYSFPTWYYHYCLSTPLPTMESGVSKYNNNYSSC